MQWLSINDAMKTLKCSRRTIWRKIEDGSLESKEEDGRRLVFVSKGTEMEAKPVTLEGGEKMEQKFDEPSIGKKTTRICLELLEDLHRLKGLASFVGQNEARPTIRQIYERVKAGKFSEEASLKRAFTELLSVRDAWVTAETNFLREFEGVEIVPREEHEEVFRHIRERQVCLKEVVSIFERVLDDIKSLIILTEGT